MTVDIIDFDIQYQDQAAQVINTGLGEHFGYVDVSKNPDLFDIARSYQDGHFLLAVKDRVVLATGALISLDAAIGQVVRMHTKSSWRGRGLAAGILQRLETQASLIGHSKIILDTEPDWADAIGFYQKMGYCEVGRTREGVRFSKLVGP